MPSLMRFITIALCVIIITTKTTVGQVCKLSYDNDTDVEGIIYGKISDTDPPGKELFSAQVVGITNIESVDSNTIGSDQYIEPVLSEGRLILRLTEHYKKYEEIEITNKITITITFKCLESPDIKIEFIELIEDTNNHDPEFMNSPYVYKLPMPFPKNIELNVFQAISARDVDITNSNVTFHLDPEDKNTDGFSISWLSRDNVDRKLFHATLVTVAAIDIVEDITFSLYATDTGEPPRSSKINITIMVDRASSILRFVRPLYIADLTDLSPKEALDQPIKFSEGNIQVQGGIDKTVNYTIRDSLNDYEKNFNLKLTDSTIDLHVVDPPAKFFLESFVVLSLTARKTGSEATTVLHISLPGLAKVPESSTTLSPVTSTKAPTENEGSGGSQPQEECDNGGYIVAITILAVLLTVATVGYVISTVLNCRKSRKMAM